MQLSTDLSKQGVSAPIQHEVARSGAASALPSAAGKALRSYCEMLRLLAPEYCGIRVLAPDPTYVFTLPTGH